MRGGTRPLILLLALTLTTVALTGCTTPEPTAPGGGQASDLTEEEALSTYQTAMASFQGKAADQTEAPDRLSMHMAMEALGGESASAEVSFFLDSQASVGIMQMSMQGLEEETDSDGPPLEAIFGDPGSGMLFATYWKTGFFGSPQSLLGLYNESAEPVDGWEDFQEKDFGPRDPNEGPAKPGAFLEDLEDIPENATVTYEETEHEGTRALKITLKGTNETGAEIDMTAIIWLDSPAEGVPAPVPASIEAIVKDPEAEDPLGQHASISMTFAFGDAADHELVPALKRLESMTFLTADEMGEGFRAGFQAGQDRNASNSRNWTIQPSQNPGLVPLDEVELRLQGAGTPPGQGQPVLTLALEDGQASQGNLTLAFEDTDEDGHVSTGDRIVLTATGDEDPSNYSLQLYDEETGLALMPAPGALLLVGLIAASAAACGRRSRG